MIVVETDNLNDTKDNKRWGFVYIIDICGKKYVGKTINLKNRYHQHKYEKRNNQHFHRSLKKYFQSGNFYIIETYYDIVKNLIKILNDREVFWISKLDTYDPKQEKGWNLTRGGDGSAGWITSEETRKKQSAASIGKRKTKLARQHMSESKKGHPAWNKGKTMKETQRQKMIGRKLTELHKQHLCENHWDCSGENHPMYGKPNPMIAERNRNVPHDIARQRAIKAAETRKRNKNVK